MSEGRRTDEIQGEIVHVYDGIEEADNQLPLWWLFTFYFAIAFATLYWFYYHEFEISPGPADAYAAEVSARANRGGTVSAEMLDALARSTSEVGEGRSVFTAQCAVCHGARGEGNIGPNLTDDAWIHGGSPMEIHTTIAEGVMDKGMPSWGASLGPEAVRRATAYVLSLRNTNVPGKPAQGTPFVPGGT
jgi:cytochrome c oxidase cbb3-type subunit III